MSKVFTDFVQNFVVNKVIPIAVGIVIAIAAISTIFALNFDESNSMEVEDTMDRELRPNEEITPEIQEKLDDIERKNLENEYTAKPREWITSGPFQIDRTEYILGEKIFIIIGGLQETEKGQIVFYRPANSTHYTVYTSIPFDGSSKPAFNYYIEPDLSKPSEICTIDDLVGDWKVVFRGTNYPDLEFRVTEEILPGDEEHYEPVC